MKKRTPVSEIMTKAIITLNQSDDLEHAEMLFKRHHIRHIPVVKKAAIIGMLSYTDLLKISFADVTEDDYQVNAVVYNMFSIAQVMTKIWFALAVKLLLKKLQRF